MTIYIFTLLIVLFLGLTMRPNSNQKRKRKYIIVVFGIIILFSALRKYSVGKDLEGHYYDTFLRVTRLPWTSAFASTSYEKGFVAFLKIVGGIFENPQWFIIWNSIFIFGITGWFIYRNSEDVVLSTFLFIACNTWFMNLNILRQGMAISTGLVAAEVLKHKGLRTKRYIIFVILVLIATSFHSTAFLLLMMPVVQKLHFKRKHVFWSILALIAVFLLYEYVFRFASSLINISRDYAEYYNNKNYGTGSVNAFALYELFVPTLCFAIAYWSIVRRKRPTNIYANEDAVRCPVQFEDSFLLYMVLFLITCRLLRMRAYIITRMAFYFMPYMWVLFPRAIKAIRSINNRRILRRILYLTLTVVFLYVGFTNATSYYGTVPYSFFWE